eukprot:TRINITY_DN8983_c0_g1_i1.p1 TRINITY_DN8983_c0_g1~~TRINITY_DN8983_c0_g1_i1.p1  ORF type:complete len:188 (+),score=55.46 TRINITY_DN8983_c0_g1_i1:67-564(+)
MATTSNLAPQVLATSTAFKHIFNHHEFVDAEVRQFVSGFESVRGGDAAVLQNGQQRLAQAGSEADEALRLLKELEGFPAAAKVVQEEVEATLALEAKCSQQRAVLREDLEPNERKEMSLLEAQSVDRKDAVDVQFAKQRGAVMKEFRDVLPLLNEAESVESKQEK